jgi:hypothetical protein
MKSRGLETTLAASGVASGTLITSIRKSEVFGSFSGVSAEHPGSSSLCLTKDVPET